MEIIRSLTSQVPRPFKLFLVWSLPVNINSSTTYNVFYRKNKTKQLLLLARLLRL